MSVTDGQVAWLRSYLAGDLEEAQRAGAEATAPGAAAGLGALVHAAFVIAARRKFGPRWTRTEVNQFVAQVGRLLSEGPSVLDPGVAEDELRRALGERLTSHPDVRSSGRIQFILLNALVQSLGTGDAELTALLGQARKAADALISARTV